MKKLILNCFIFSSPLLLCLAFFTFLDPFGIFFKDNCIAEPSDDVVSTRILLRTFPTKAYTSFVFGNSRTHAFRDRDWKKYIGSNEVIFRYGAPGESVLNIKKKLELIAAKGIGIKNALIIIDDGILRNTDNRHRFYRGPVYEHSPLTSNTSFLQFYTNYIRYYFEDFFFAKHIVYELTGKYQPVWMGSAFKDPGIRYQKFVSAVYDSEADSLIETDFRRYKEIYRPDYSFIHKSLPSASSVDLVYLESIRKTLESRGVDYKIIIPPDFNKEKVAPAVYMELKQIFDGHLYDFTGKNRVTTDSTMNFENLHFTPRAARIILDSVYHKGS